MGVEGNSYSKSFPHTSSTGLCMLTGFVWNGLWVLELAAVGDSRVNIEGDVKLELTSFRPHDSRFAVHYHVFRFMVTHQDLLHLTLQSAVASDGYISNCSVPSRSDLHFYRATLC